MSKPIYYELTTGKLVPVVIITRTSANLYRVAVTHTVGKYRDGHTFYSAAEHLVHRNMPYALPAYNTPIPGDLLPE